MIKFRIQKRKEEEFVTVNGYEKRHRDKFKIN